MARRADAPPPRRHPGAAALMGIVRCILDFSERGHSGRMPLGIAARSHAGQSRFGRQRQSGGPVPPHSKSEARNPRAERRPSSEIRRPKPEAKRGSGFELQSRPQVSVFGFRPSACKATPVPISLPPRFSGVWCARAMAGTGHLMSLHGSSIADQDGPSWWSVTSTVGKRIETVETVSMASAPNVTPLKRGVNERCAEPGV